MFAAKSLTINEGQFADRTLALVVMTATNDKMSRFAPPVAVAAVHFCLNLFVSRAASVGGRGYP